MEFQTRRLLLREIEQSDLMAIHSYASDLDNVIHMTWGPNTMDETKAFIENCIRQAHEENRRNFDFAIVLKETKELIGAIGLYVNPDCTEAMIGWVLRKTHWNQGFVSEAALEVLGFGFETLRLHRIVAKCDVVNIGSWRVMEKCGMRLEGRHIKNRKSRMDSEPWVDEVFYALLEEEWFFKKMGGF